VQNVVNAISLGAIYALFSLSVAVIFGVARIVNFANGEMLTIAGYAVVIAGGLAWPLATGIAVAVTVATALLMDSAVFRWFRQAPETTLLIVSFGVSYFLQNGLLLLEGSRARTVSFGSSLIKSVSIGGTQVGVLSLVTIGVTAVLIAALGLLLRGTVIGRQLRAAAEDFAMARYLGVPANRVIAYAFAISGVLAAIAGILLTISTAAVTPTFGVEPVILAFVAVVIGGIGSLGGAALGGVLLGAVTVALQVILPASLKPYRDAFVFSLVVVMLLVRPQGLLPSASAKERV
jgi:branched-chain amino acid transport system permease protein